MKIMILGADGYLGWPTAMHFSKLGHEVIAVDNSIKRQWEMECGVEPLERVHPMKFRAKKWNEITGNTIQTFHLDLLNNRALYKLLESSKPDTIIHYVEQPSAPFSMIDRDRAVMTQHNNVVGNLNLLFAIKSTCPNAHLIKLGTMGEYGTPNIDIEEGYLEVEHNGRKDTVPYPKQPFSFYHLSKVHDSHNIAFTCKTWGLRATDLNQGVVYGSQTPETNLSSQLNTSFHYDAVFGTVVNRFCVQAVMGVPLTVYGEGHQTRSYLNINDTLQCVELAALNEPKAGEFRVFNQFTEIFSINDIATLVKHAASEYGLDVQIENIKNPRVEKSEHYYNPKNDKLLSLGLKPQKLSDVVVEQIFNDVLKNKENINEDVIMPTVQWHSN